MTAARIQERVEELEFMCKFMIEGGSISRASLFDEEGVEGWCFSSRYGEDHHMIGIWDEGLPDGLDEETVKFLQEQI